MGTVTGMSQQRNRATVSGGRQHHRCKSEKIGRKERIREEILLNRREGDMWRGGRSETWIFVSKLKE